MRKSNRVLLSKGTEKGLRSERGLHGVATKGLQAALLLRTDREMYGLEFLVPSWFEHRLWIIPLMTYFFEVWSFSVIRCSHRRKTLWTGWSVPVSLAHAVLVLLPARNSLRA